ncbi:MAG: cyclic nucleotide-binding domain-containing protein [Anaerolineaceae bacterium]|jgi:hypothetical protein
MQADQDEILNILREVTIFGSLSQAQIPILADQFLRIHIEENALLYNKGDQTDGLYIVCRGTLNHTDPEVPGIEKFYRRADLAGEESLHRQPIREETVFAATETDLLFLENSQVQALLLDNPLIAETIQVIRSSRNLAKCVPMPWLQEGETVYLMTRRHPIFLFLSSVTPIIVFSLIMLLSVMLFSTTPSFGLAIIGIAFAFCFLWLGWNIHNWSNDFYLITNKRMIWVEHVSGLYDSRQEAPLGTLITSGLKTSRLGAIFGYSDVIVRTYIGDIRFERVEHGFTISKMVESFWNRSKKSDLDLDAKEISVTLRQKFGKELGEISMQEMQAEAEQLANQPPARETGFLEWLFADFFKVRFEAGGTTTYRKHWFVLLRNIFWPVLGIFVSAWFVGAVITRNLRFDYTMALVLGGFAMLGMILWLLYAYIDWKNDIFQLTPNQVIDIDRKPLGKESRRAAPLENILSIEYERKGIFPMMFNFGTVFITVGNTQLSFNDVYQPSVVQQDIFTRMGAQQEAKERRMTDQERERVAQWFKIYHDEIQADAPTHVLNTPPR